MSSLQGLGALTWAYLLQSFRSKTGLFWNLFFPLVWLFLFAAVFAQGNPETASMLMPGVFTLTIVSASFFGTSYLLVNERELGILRRYRVTPVTAVTVVVANALRGLVTMLVALGLQGVVGWLIFDIRFRGSLLQLGLLLLLGAATFIPLGLLVGSVAQDMRAAPAISNALFFPLVFLSGATLPLHMMPGWLQTLARILPSTYLVEALQGVMVRARSVQELLAPVTVLVVTTIVGAGLNAYLFRWESSEPIDRRRLALAAGGIAVIYLAAALLAPPLQMRAEPEPIGSPPAAVGEPQGE